jgi:hypothetical protein
MIGLNARNPTKKKKKVVDDRSQRPKLLQKEEKGR